jgi:hypothetical protein
MQVESLKAQSGLPSASETEKQAHKLLADSDLLIEEFLDGSGI